MQNNAAVNFAPAVADDRRIDVCIEGSDAVVKLSDWVEGLGWCTQKTLRLDESMLDDMQRMIAAARIRIKNSRTSPDEAVAPANVLSFPLFD